MSSAAVVLCLGFLVCSVFGGEDCTIDDPSSLSTKTSYCVHGCCGTAADYNRDCCKDEKSVPTELGDKHCFIDDDSSPYSPRTSYCEHGCCGTAAHENRRCCEDESSSISIYLYIGGGVGGSGGLITLCLLYYFCCRK